MKSSRTARYYYLKILRLKGDPHSLALGTAVGILVGISPTIPIQSILTILLAWLLRGNLIVALIVAHLTSNPLTWLPQYYLCWRLGHWLLPGRLSWQRIEQLMAFLGTSPNLGDGLASIGQFGIDAVTVMLVGGLLLALPLALIGYFFSLRFFRTIQHKRREKHVLS